MKLDKHVIDLNKFSSDNLGSLFVLDSLKLPFIPQRFFVVHNVPKGVSRGAHAHRKCKQLIIVTEGEVEILIDNGKEKESIRMVSPQSAIYIPEMTWSTQKTVSNSSTICVLASDSFDEKDYFYDYFDFKSALENELGTNTIA